MIVDQLKHLNRYQFPQAEQILEFISKNDCLNLPNEQIDIHGQELFVRVMQYEPKAAQEKDFETHRRYADLQYIVSGIEVMQVVPREFLKPIKGYDAKGDYEFFKADDHISDLVVKAGEFVVFYPGEAHRPSCLYENHTGTVKKLVFKVKID